MINDHKQFGNKHPNHFKPVHTSFIQHLMFCCFCCFCCFCFAAVVVVAAAVGVVFPLFPRFTVALPAKSAGRSSCVKTFTKDLPHEKTQRLNCGANDDVLAVDGYEIFSDGNLHPGKGPHGTQKWRFGGLCSVSNGRSFHVNFPGFSPSTHNQIHNQI